MRPPIFTDMEMGRVPNEDPRDPHPPANSASSFPGELNIWFLIFLIPEGIAKVIPHIFFATSKENRSRNRQSITVVSLPQISGPSAVPDTIDPIQEILSSAWIQFSSSVGL